MLKSIVLLSGGLDSAVNFRCALNETTVALALTFDYGQRSAPREIERAGMMCRLHDVPHRTVSLDWLADITQTALVNEEEALPSPGDLDDPVAGRKTAEAVWVPNRNGVFINIAAAFAESAGASMIVVGFNAEEARTFPDNSPKFLSAANRFLSLSTLSRPKVVCYTTDLDKKGIVDLGRTIDAPLGYVWPCYRGGEDLCGHCESCLRFFRALEACDSVDWFASVRFGRESR
jgi:7-cyano-7-deazaguanine synthase